MVAPGINRRLSAEPEKGEKGMSVRKRAAGLLTGLVTVAALAVPLAPGAAQASTPWLDDPGTCTNHQTARSAVISGRTVEVRYGNCNGKQYGWGRIRGFVSWLPDRIRFEVDINGDRIPDGHSVRLARHRNYTAAYPTASGSRRAFRACFVTSDSQPCTPNNSTAWW
ncbi:hypothetical protein FHX40_2483 [Thermopolyspora flexuosa]|mgnify:CR=1 FL=1|uniref:Uncharacterized protein n=2 Tax=Thermopolyspora flexuosa TaxID=103836 RepID=A0A543IYV9_9ACTN|nr:hypothetical protein FHX40_2483 [Thermopolyspora flexuosa]